MRPDPILAAITHHRQAWDAFQVAPEGEDSLTTCLEMHEALDALLATSCSTRPGACALMDHLRWWLTEEAEFARDYQPSYGRAEDRVAEILMLMGAAASGIDGADPIFPALDAANTAETAHFLACEALDEGDDVSMRRCNAACDRAGTARRDLERTFPRTLGGLRALAAHYVRWGEYAAEDTFLHIARSLQGTDLKTTSALLQGTESPTPSVACTTIWNSDLTPRRSGAIQIPGLPEITAAWRSLPPAIQERIGVAVVDMVFNDFVHGDACVVGEQPQDRAFPDDTDEHDAIRDAAAEASNRRLNELTPLIEGLFPDLFGQPGENPAWCPNPGPSPARAA